MSHFPTKPATRRLAIVYETSPGAYEYLAAQLLASAGIDRDACYIGVLGPTLRDDLVRYQPHFVLLFDRYGGCLRTFTGEKRGIDQWRGSLFMSDYLVSLTDLSNDNKPVKCLATYHPQRIQLEYGLTSVVRFDVERAARELNTDTLEVPVDHIEVELTKEKLLNRLYAIVALGTTVATDIEGYPHGISCIGFATSANNTFVVPFIKHDNTSYWSEEDELELWQAVKDVLEAPHVTKVCHNALYELFCLAWAYGIVITGLEHDTMVMHFELYAELPKDLGFCTSIYTKHPYYKSERKATDDRVLLLYNGKDCCRTYEIWQAMSPKLMPKQREHYEFNMSLLVPLSYMSLRGIRYDKQAAERRLAEVQQQIYEKQDEINGEAAGSREALKNFYAVLHTWRLEDGTGCDIQALVPIFTEAFCKARCNEQREVEETTWQPMRWQGKKWVKAGKRQAEIQLNQVTSDGEPPTCSADVDNIWFKPITKRVLRNVPVAITTFEDVQRFAKDSCVADCKAALNLLREIVLDGNTSAARGRLATLLGLHVKVNSTSEGGDAQFYIYDHLKLPKQFKKEGNKLTTKLCTDDEAIIKAWAQSKDDRALTFLQMRKLVTSTKYLTASPDEDGRLRFGLNLVATPTGRMAAYGSPTGSSDINPQTIGKSFRDLYPADIGCEIGQFDLDGSDSWSVAAYAASLGDPTMLNDNLARLKPAKILACIYEQGPEINKLNHAQLKVECAKVDGEGWLYFACKRVLHGSNYGMGKVTMANQILTDSYKLLGKPVHLDAATCERIQKQAFFVRYPGVLTWHTWMQRELKTAGTLTTCDGFQRKFYGRKDDNSTLKEALAHTPQVVTTHAIKLTLGALWNDPENRHDNGSLRVEPLLCVHDSLVSQWHKEDREFARAKLKACFEHEMTVRGVSFKIPVNGTAGDDWKNQSIAM